MLPNYLSRERSVLEAIARKRCLTISLLPRDILCRVLGKYIVFVDPEDVGLTPHLCLNGFWESWVTIALARVMQRGWYCVDVGANQGYFTLLMADAVEASGRVLAVEPNPNLTERLNHSLEVNGFRSYSSVLAKAAFSADNKKLRM